RDSDFRSVVVHRRAHGFDALAVGQGADELFGGYEKVVRLDHRVDAETVRGAVREQLRSLADQLPRDVLTIEATGLEPVAPFLHDAVVEAALQLPDELLADEDERKRGFRRVAARYLPAEVASRDKKAVQYGSLVARELDRLARQADYKRRMDDHVGKYIVSLLEDEETRAGSD
ncbi:asparagine synthase C-terminal domain-containing protein, partial [Natrinema soli]